MSIFTHKGDLPADFQHNGIVAVDSETLGLNPLRDRLCVVQLCGGDGNAHLIQLDEQTYDQAHNLKALMEDENVIKLFHYARFDVAVIKHYLSAECRNVYCTKIASKLARTYTDRHGLKDVCRELAGVELDKQQQSSDWAAETLSEQQQKYAANDVLYLHAVKEKLDMMLARSGRTALAQSCFDFINTRAALDLAGWDEVDIFSHR